MTYDKVEAVFDEQKVTTAKELSEFLFYFRIVYGLCVELFGKYEFQDILRDHQRFAKELEDRIKDQNLDHLRKEFFDRDLRERELIISEIGLQSPLLILFIGVVSSVTLSVIISGGEVEIDVKGKFKAKLRPIADGLKKLKNLFHRR